MTVLVTGGAGYIGSHTVRALRAAAATSWCSTRSRLGNEAALLGAPLVVGDIADVEPRPRASSTTTASIG